MKAAFSPSPAKPDADAAIAGFDAAAFEAALAAHAKAPAWWIERKKRAYERFRSLPLPRRTDEAWRFSTLSGISLAGIRPGSGEASAAQATPFGAPAISFANNRLAALSAAPEIKAQGVVVLPISEALRSHPDLLREHFMAQPQKLGSEKFASLHAAFLEDGAFILVPKGVEVASPIVVSHWSSGEGAAVFPHTLVVAGENAKVSVVDCFASEGFGAQLACGANDLYAAHGAHIEYVATQCWAAGALSFQLNSTIVRRDARVQSVNLHLGGRQCRHESLSQLQAPGAFSEMLALTAAAGEQEFDQRTLQVHQAPDTRSDLLYKNALRGAARTIFSGLIIVDPDAQRTDAYQSNRNLMLSDAAEAHSLPGLEIQANDVRCTHGATTSRIDPEQEFYLAARGISKALADELLVFGFFEDVLNRLENSDLHPPLTRLVQSKFRR